MAKDTGSFIWYELMTPDADAAGAFYGAVVGWAIGVGGETDYRMIRRDDGGHAGGVLPVTPEMADGGARAGWYGYVHVADVDAAIARFEEAGGTLLFDRTMEGVGRMALLSDAAGAPIYVMDPVPPEGDPDARSDVFSYDEQPQRVCWNELATTGQDEAIALYTGLFGWRQEGAMPMGGMGDYKFLYRGEGMLGAVMEKPEAMPRSNWLYYIGVDDIDRAMAAVADGGGTILRGPDEIPGGSFTANCLDPQGAAFGLAGPRAG